MMVVQLFTTFFYLCNGVTQRNNHNLHHLLIQSLLLADIHSLVMLVQFLLKLLGVCGFLNRFDQTCTSSPLQRERYSCDCVFSLYRFHGLTRLYYSIVVTMYISNWFSIF